jgi:hypothetical protein
LIFSKCAGLPEKVVNERRFTMVNVGDNGDIADSGVTWFLHNGKKSRKIYVNVSAALAVRAMSGVQLELLMSIVASIVPKDCLSFFL